jgi:hypothetical protein
LYYARMGTLVVTTMVQTVKVFITRFVWRAPHENQIRSSNLTASYKQQQ